jgi:hypothetical protein
MLQFRVFLSGVTSEFGKARDALGADLRSRDTLLRVQSDFRQEAGSETTRVGEVSAERKGTSWFIILPSLQLLAGRLPRCPERQSRSFERSGRFGHFGS